MGTQSAVPTDRLTDSLLIRLVADQQLTTSAGGYEYALDWQPGVSRVLCLAHDGRLLLLNDRQLADHRPLGPLLDLGLRNLYLTLLTESVALDDIEHERARFTVAMSSHQHLASMALLLPEALEQWRPGVQVSGGVLFCVPFANQLAFHVIDDPADCLRALTLLPMFAANGFDQGDGPVSPHTYLWHEGSVSQLTRFKGTTLEVTPGSYLEALFERIADELP